MPDADVDPVWIAGDVVSLMHDPERLAQMARAAAGAGHREADESLADMVEDAWRNGGRRG